MIGKKKLEGAVGLLLALGAWTPGAHAGACLGSGAPSACAAALPVAAEAPGPGAILPSLPPPGVGSTSPLPFGLPLPFALPPVVPAPLLSLPQGQSYGHWAAQWWNWALQVPRDKNPLDDRDGRHCAERQVGDVWFLAGFATGEPVVRHCTIPARKSLFLPLINFAYMAWLNDPPEQRTDAFLRAQAACTRPAQIEVVIDHVRLPVPTLYFTGPGGSPSPLFNVQLPVDNRFGYQAQGEQAVQELALSPVAEQGYYLFLPPLAPGDHRLHWVATGCSEGGAQDITYLLKVQ